MTNKFTQKAESALGRALSSAEKLGHTYIGSEHLLLALASEEESIAASILSSKGIDKKLITEKIKEITPEGAPSILSPADMSPGARQIIERAGTEATRGHASKIGTEHLLLAIIDHRMCVATSILERCDAPIRDIKSDIEAYIASYEKVKNASHSEKPEPKAKIHGAPTLSLYGRDLSALCAAGRIDPIIGRDKETEHVVRILSRRMKNNPCLIGEPGVGKTAVIEGLATRIHEGQVPETLRGKRIVTLDISAMLAGAKYRGEFEERVKNVMNEISKNPDIILFIDEFHTIVGAGAAEGAVDAANIIKPALARSELQMIGATTLAEYRTHIEKDAALERRFQPVIVNEPSESEAIEILRGLRHKYEAHHKVKISDAAISAAVKLSMRYIPDRFLPDKAIDLIDEAASGMRIQHVEDATDQKSLELSLEEIKSKKEAAILREDFDSASKLRCEELEIISELSRCINHPNSDEINLSISDADIANIVTSWTGIPVASILAEEAKHLANLEGQLKGIIIGQDNAVHTVSTAIKRGRVGLKDPARPIGSFLFVGKTGVGKTQLARSLAELMFGGAASLLRFDMAEYMEKHSVSKLIGAPPGYVGYGEGGRLTEKVRRHPYSVLLFDEIEKAHPDIFNILLSILEDGTVTDSVGRRIDFRNTVIIMTSNIGSDAEQHRPLGFASDDRRDQNASNRERILSRIKSTLPPEFLNRIDEIVVFDALSREDIKLIAEGMLSELSGRAQSIGISLEFSDNVATHLANEAYDESFGARSVRREIIHRIENRLSTIILEGALSPTDTLLVDIDGGEIVFLKNSICAL